MSELSSNNAARVIGVSDETIRRYVERDLLPARRVGIKGIIRIDTEDLKTFAEKYEYHYDDELAETLSK